MNRWKGIAAAIVSVTTIVSSDSVTAFLNAHGLAGKVVVIVVGAVGTIAALFADPPHKS